jgi:lactoylglutathione lyase
MTAVAFRDGFPIVYVRDLPTALAFYRDALGFVETYRHPPDGEPGFVSLQLENTKVGLVVFDSPESFLGRTPGDGIRFELWLYCDDVDTAVAGLADRGVPVLREPEDMPWGERLAYVADPDGNPISIARG